MNVTSRNLELKVRCGADGLTDVRNRLTEHGHRVVISMQQVDTYFSAPTGRLKVREIRPLGGQAHAELIGYQRPTDEGSRWSAYQVVPIDPAETDKLLNLLTITHQRTVIVHKRRDVALWGNTRVHLDEVEGLGAFVELETVIDDQDDNAATAEHQAVIAGLGLDRFPSEAGSYSDLLA